MRHVEREDSDDGRQLQVQDGAAEEQERVEGEPGQSGPHRVQGAPVHGPVGLEEQVEEPDEGQVERRQDHQQGCESVSIRVTVPLWRQAPVGPTGRPSTRPHSGEASAPGARRRRGGCSGAGKGKTSWE
uniref:Uncharacterized protein n=1 Tax=uncultured Armatimonadetes bacterium TaxID=157466 RepID=A0A6J4ITT1_9BACT|nr:hypothetical protein AVDCRST_MAG63-2405 [uncultured Armatimonadetes bacterium]